jgi:hypothetical protein
MHLPSLLMLILLLTNIRDPTWPIDRTVNILFEASCGIVLADAADGDLLAVRLETLLNLESKA